MSTGRKKPVTLEWQGNLLGAAAEGADAVRIKGSGGEAAGPASAPKAKTPPQSSVADGSAQAWKGKLRVRREVKGRGGHPAFVLYEFAPGASGAQVKELASALRASLGCGGSDDGREIVLNAPNWERLKQALDKRGIGSVTSGGF